MRGVGIHRGSGCGFARTHLTRKGRTSLQGNSPGRGGGGLVGIEDAGAGALFGEVVTGVIEGTDTQGETAATDAAVELVAEASEAIDAVGEAITPVRG